MYRRIFLLCFILLLIPIQIGAEYDPNTFWNGSCKVMNDGACGSGSVISQTHKYYIIMTNRHVAGSQGQVELDFFNGPSVYGTVYWSRYGGGLSADVSLVYIAKGKLGNFKPTIIPLAPRNHKVEIGTKFWTPGYPYCGRMNVQRGTIVENNDNIILHFQPIGVNGRSGSPLIATIGQYSYVIGLLTWGTGINTGGAQSSNYIHKLFSNQMNKQHIEIPKTWKELGGEK